MCTLWFFAFIAPYICLGIAGQHQRAVKVVERFFLYSCRVACCKGCKSKIGATQVTKLLLMLLV